MPSQTYFRDLDVGKMSIGGINVGVQQQQKPFTPLVSTPEGVITIPESMGGGTAQGITAGSYSIIINAEKSFYSSILTANGWRSTYFLADSDDCFVLRNKNGDIITTSEQPLIRNSPIAIDEFDFSSGRHYRHSSTTLGLTGEGEATTFMAGASYKNVGELIYGPSGGFGEIDGIGPTAYFNTDNIVDFAAYPRFYTNSEDQGWLNNFRGFSIPSAFDFDFDLSETGNITVTHTMYDFPNLTNVDWDEIVYPLPFLHDFQQKS